MVVMDKKDYIDKATSLIDQPGCRAINRNPTNKLKAKLITLLKNKKGNRIRRQNLYVHVSHGMHFPQILWASKIHKTNTPQAYSI